MIFLIIAAIAIQVAINYRFIAKRDPYQLSDRWRYNRSGGFCTSACRPLANPDAEPTGISKGRTH